MMNDSFGGFYGSKKVVGDFFSLWERLLMGNGDDLWCLLFS